MASIPRPDMPEPLLPSEAPPELPVPGQPEPEMDPAAPVPEIGGREGLERPAAGGAGLSGQPIAGMGREERPPAHRTRI